MKSFLFILILLISATGFCENYLLNGGQSSTIKYKMTQKVEPQNGILTVDLSYVIPETFESPTYNQQIKNFNVSFNINPKDKKEWIDKHGNKIIKYSWYAPEKPIDVKVEMKSLQ